MTGQSLLVGLRLSAARLFFLRFSVAFFLSVSFCSLPVLAQCTGACTASTVNGDVIIRFTGSGTFTPPEGIVSIQYLVVGGGGGGGGVIATSASDAGVGGGGGGGAGGVRSGTVSLVSQQSYGVTVGVGGTGGVGNGTAGGTGGASIFSSITAIGGGGGGSVGMPPASGGSGGGGRLAAAGAAGTIGQGNAGGAGAGGTNATGGAGGGGGAGAVGVNGSANTGGAGGAGTSNNLMGTSTIYGGGGGGGGYFNGSPNGVAGAGGTGGGGASPNSRGLGGNGTANTGGGGGGAGGGVGSAPAYNGGSGGSGVVVIRYTPGGPRYAVATGTWGATTTWSSSSCTGAAGAAVPTAADDVVICNSRTVTLAANGMAKSVVIQSGNQNASLNHNAGISLTVGSGGLTLDSPTADNITKTWNIGAGSAVVNGPLVINGGNNNNRISRVLLSSGTLDINGNLTFNGADPVRTSLQATGAANIYLAGSIAVPGGSARISPGTASTFTYDGTGTQTAMLGVSDINYHNLIFAGSGIKNQTSWSVPTISGFTRVDTGVTFNNSASVTYAAEFLNNGTTNATAAHQYLGNFTNNGNYSATAAQQYRANFINSGSFTSGEGLHTFNGAATQQLTGATTFSWLSIDNLNGLQLNSGVVVSTQLLLVNGPVITANNLLRINQTGWTGVSRTNGWVAGRLALWFPTGYQSRTFDIGDVTAYRPVSVTAPNVTTAGHIIISISQSAEDHPQIASSPLNPNSSVNRWWTISGDGAAIQTMDVVFNYLAADLDAGAVPQNFVIGRYTGSTWEDVAEGALNTTNSQAIGITGFGQFAIAESGANNPLCDTLIGGVYGQYFNNVSLSGAAAATRLDGPIDFDWGAGAPGPAGINGNQISVRWSGLLRVTQSGNYSFQTVSDDGVRLWVNDQLIINNWSDHAAATDTSGNVMLTAGQAYNIRMEYYENTGQSVIRLRWLVPGASNYVAVPSGPTPTLGAGLYHCAVTEICSGVTPAVGLSGAYFNNVSLSGSAAGRRVDGPIDFQWNQLAPGVAGINAEEFSVQWSGRLLAAQTGSYQFQTRSDDGVRLWVNGQLLIDQWNDHSATDHTSGSVSLLAGQVYTIRMEYYERFLDAEIRLRWRVPGSSAFVPIPAGTSSAINAGLYHCPVVPPVSYYVISHAGTGVTCAAEPITISAVGPNNVPIAPPANTTVVLSTDPATGVWVGGNTYVFSGTESSFVKYLQQTTAASLNINVTDGTAAEGSGSADPAIIFGTAGLRFYSDGSFSAPLQNMVAGVAEPYPVVRAVFTNTDTGACETRAAGPQTVALAYECVNPSTCSAGQTFSVNGGAAAANAAGAVTTYSPVGLTFNSGSAGIPLNFGDVGQLRLHASMTIPPQGNDPAVTISGSSAPFVVKPYTLVVSEVSGNPATTSGGLGFVAAGMNFPVRVEARNFTNQRTPNFGNEAASAANNVALRISALAYPSVGVTGTLTGAGQGAFVATTPAGAVETANVTWNEVGTIRLEPYLEGGDYLGAGDLVEFRSSGNVGRFYPHHFTLKNSTVVNSCSGVVGATDFSYMGQAELPINYEFEAQNRNGERTNNYTSAVYTGTATLVFVAENLDAGTNMGSRVNAPVAQWSMGILAPPTNSFAGFSRQVSGAPDGPFTSLQWGVQLTGDIDGRTLSDLDMSAATTGECQPSGCTAKLIGSPLNLVYGRLRLDDAFGPESVDLPVNFYTEQWVGSYFSRHLGDSCTQILRSAINYPSGDILNSGNLTVGLSGGSTTGVYSAADSIMVRFLNGSAGHYFTAPVTGTGAFDVDVDLTSYPWLRYDWNQDGTFDDISLPAASFGFGSYRGHDRIIYWRERFQ